MKGNKGFSLIELMVVVGIMGILASLAIPRFATYQAKAKRTEAQSLLSQIYTLMTVNFNETGSYLLGPNDEVIAAAAAAGDIRGRTAYNTANCTFNTGWTGAIGFAITPCTNGQVKQMPTYGYWLSAVAQNTFTAIAEDIAGVANRCDDDGAGNNFKDELSIDNEKHLVIRIDGVNCKRGAAASNANTAAPGA